MQCIIIIAAPTNIQHSEADTVCFGIHTYIGIQHTCLMVVGSLELRKRKTIKFSNMWIFLFIYLKILTYVYTIQTYYGIEIDTSSGCGG